ncbi:hypothetical protein LOK49_Contig138G00009 [Camellia lanceoleosa]|nr:hypothetical protein LOK49_Contig138G00009 [Camellia lanceoleosa]
MLSTWFDAPGSRSSPLAIAVSTHPHTTCISCFDERSLAFHAVGYARGSHKPAVVITSSGTAVSNLLPAVNHFGPFVRFFYGLPASTDSILARMVLTTLDSAVYWATSSPYGPVHINCPFREPLDNSPQQWMLSCSKGLDFWMSSGQPFAMYFQVQYSYACNGLRLRKYLTYLDIEKNFLFIDHLDHSLLSNSVRGWAYADVIIQIGSRITSEQANFLDARGLLSMLIYTLVARWAQQQGKMSVVSAKFESSLFLSAYLQFSYYLELQKADICMAMNKEPSASIAHGLGTYHWLKEDITAEPLNIRHNPCSGFVEASVDNAGHLLGNFQVDSKMQNHCIREAAQERSSSIEVVADILQKLIQNITPGKVTLVGYSMGARIALYMALRCASKFEGAVISGSPGLKDVSTRKIRKAKDDSRACSLINHGIELFLDTWYAGALWNSLRDHPHFKQMVASRLQHDDARTLAKVLSDSSIGRQL